jgi:two-component system, LytTR family, response regulator LytT
VVDKRCIIIVDDEPLARDELAYLIKSQHLDFEVVDAVDSTAKAWELMQSNSHIEGIFLDIDIQTESKRAGLDFALNLSRLASKPWIIFVTGYQEYAVEAFQSFPINYLIKPVDDALIERSLNWVRNHCPHPISKDKRLAIRHRISDRFGEKAYCTEYVEIDEILYIQKNNGVNTVRIGLVHGEVLDGVNSTLKEWEAFGFFQIHRRNFVNLRHVRRETPRIGENTVYKLVFKDCPIELDIGPDYLLGLHEELNKLC